MGSCDYYKLLNTFDTSEYIIYWDTKLNVRKISNKCISYKMLSFYKKYGIICRSIVYLIYQRYQLFKRKVLVVPFRVHKIIKFK